MLQQVYMVRSKHFTAESIGFVDHSSLLISITVHLTQLTFHSKNVSTAKMCQILLSFSSIDNNVLSQPLKTSLAKTLEGICHTLSQEYIPT